MEVEDALANPSTDVVVPGAAAPHHLLGWRRAMPWVAAAVVGGIIVGLTIWSLTPPSTRPVERFVVTTPETELFAAVVNARNLVISPDGTRVIYRATSADGADHLYVRPVDRLEGEVLFSTAAEVVNPIVSPDGNWVAFATSADRTWKKVSVLGGPPVTLFPRPSGARGASWGPDDTIIFAENSSGTGLFRAPAAGGEPEVLTTPDTEQGEVFHWWPEILPGGEAVLFTIVRAATSGQGQDNEIAVLDLATGERKVLVPGGSDPHYAGTGHIVYGSDGTLRAVPFDLERLEVTGDPVPVLEGLITHSTGAAEFSLSADGSLLYAAGTSLITGPLRTLVWVDRQGREEAINAPRRRYYYPRISPDGTRVALDIRDQENDVWVWDLARETLTRLTFDSGLDRVPAWAPDGRRIAFSRQPAINTGVPTLSWQAADGTGSAEPLMESTNNQAFPTSFSPDGTRLLLWEESSDTGDDITMLTLDGEGRATPLVQTAFGERNAMVSPDGRWLAYESDESGQLEIYVRPFPEVEAGRWQVSTGGGTRPLWARNGHELFYFVLQRHVAVEAGVPGAVEPGRVMVVPFQADGATFAAGNPQMLFEGDYVVPQSGRMYDVSPDGQRFLMIKEVKGIEDTSVPPQLILVRNWFEELKQRVPTGN